MFEVKNMKNDRLLMILIHVSAFQSSDLTGRYVNQDIC